jgi:hypothetical protein
MAFDCYQLPGPARFMTTLEGDLRQGKSVVLQTPKLLPAGFSKTLRERVREYFHWEVVDCETHCIPEQFTAFIDRQSGARPSAAPTPSLYDRPGFGGKGYWLDGVPLDCWKDWSAFLGMFAHDSRQRELDRSVFVVQGNASHSLTQGEDVLLVARQWDAQVSTSDALLYAYQILSPACAIGIRGDLRATLCAELALWDFELCGELSRLGLSCLTEPGEFLLSYARSRSWHELPADAPDEVLWNEGIVHEIDGRRRLHSAYLAVRRQKSELKRRVWQAELKVLFPFLEEKRVQIVEGFGRHFELPYTLEDGRTITEPLDLELGAICRQFAKSPRVPRKLRDFLRLLRDVRNSLAHLKAIDSAHLTGQLFDLDIGAL